VNALKKVGESYSSFVAGQAKLSKFICGPNKIYICKWINFHFEKHFHPTWCQRTEFLRGEFRLPSRNFLMYFAGSSTLILILSIHLVYEFESSIHYIWASIYFIILFESIFLTGLFGAFFYRWTWSSVREVIGPPSIGLCLGVGASVLFLSVFYPDLPSFF